MSCDNVQENGKVARSAFLAYIAAMEDYKLLSWVETNVAFVNSMVDRITPVPDISVLTPEIERKFLIRDECPVMAEDFVQFVVEDKFIGARPRFEEVGIEMVSEVSSFEKMKLRLLNAAHSLIAYTGTLKGYHYAH